MTRNTWMADTELQQRRIGLMEHKNHHIIKATILATATFAVLLTGTGFVSAQVWDNPPGSRFQDDGIREDMGLPPLRPPYQWRGGRYTYAFARSYSAPRFWRPGLSRWRY
jgi:hypothetical protein